MRTLTINVGLNNNPMSASEVVDYFASFNSELRLMAYQIKDSEYNGEVEPTFVAMFENKTKYDSTIFDELEFACEKMTQECIALSMDTGDMLVYNPSFNGDRFKFDSKYFLTL